MLICALFLHFWLHSALEPRHVDDLHGGKQRCRRSAHMQACVLPTSSRQRILQLDGDVLGIRKPLLASQSSNQIKAALNGTAAFETFIERAARDLSVILRVMIPHTAHLALL